MKLAEKAAVAVLDEYGSATIHPELMQYVVGGGVADQVKAFIESNTQCDNSYCFNNYCDNGNCALVGCGSGNVPCV